MTYGAAHRGARHDEQQHERGEQRLQPFLGPAVERLAEAGERRGDGRGHREQQQVEGEPVGAGAVGERHEQDGAERKKTAKHPARISSPAASLLR